MKRAITRIWEAILDNIGAAIAVAIFGVFSALYAPLRSQLASYAIALRSWLFSPQVVVLPGVVWTLAVLILLVLLIHAYDQTRPGRIRLASRPTPVQAVTVRPPPVVMPSMELIFKDEGPYTTTEHPITKPAYPHSIALRRIGVRNLTDRTINGVKIFLVDIENRDIRSELFRAGELRFMHDNTPDFAESRNGVSLIAGAPPVFIDVVRMEEAGGPGRGGIEICFANPALRRDVAARHYVLTIRAEGSDGASCTRKFIVNVEPVTIPDPVRDRALRFRPEDEG